MLRAEAAMRRAIIAALPRRSRPLSAALRLLSASIRKLAEVTTTSPSCDAVADFDIARRRGGRA